MLPVGRLGLRPVAGLLRRHVRQLLLGQLLGGRLGLRRWIGHPLLGQLLVSRLPGPGPVAGLLHIPLRRPHLLRPGGRRGIGRNRLLGLRISAMAIGLRLRFVGPVSAHQGAHFRPEGSACPLRWRGLSLLLLHAVRYEYERNQQQADKNRHIGSRRILDVVGNVAHHRQGKNHFAHDAALANQGIVHVVVGVALGAEAVGIRVVRVRHLFHNSVRGHRIAAHAEGDHVAYLQRRRIHLFHIHQRPDGIGRLHGAGQHAVHL